jgi:hypothetical protein
VEWLDKITEEAMPCGKIGIVAIRFLNVENQLTPQDWILCPASEFFRLQALQT